MDNNSQRRKWSSDQPQEQSIGDDDDNLASEPMRAQKGLRHDRLGSVDVESYGGISPSFSHEKQIPPFNPSIDPQAKLQETGRSVFTKQKNIEFEPSEAAYDETQANFPTRSDDTSTEQKGTVKLSEGSAFQTSYLSLRVPEFDTSDEHYDDLQKSNRLDDNARRQSWTSSADGANENVSSRAPRASFGTRKRSSSADQGKPYYPGAASPNWAAGTTAPSEIPHSTAQSSLATATDYLPQSQTTHQRSRQSSFEAVKPSSYLSIPPMVPSELAMEALNHPSSVIDQLWGLDLGIADLFDRELASGQRSSQASSQQFPKKIITSTESELVTPPTVPTSRALDCYFYPSPTSQDWAMGVDTIGLKELMTPDDETPEIDTADNSVNRVHKLDQRPKTSSALHTVAEGQTNCIAIVQPIPHALALSQYSIFDAQDLAGIIDPSPMSTRRVHQTIQRPNVHSDWHLGSEDKLADVPFGVAKGGSWSSYVAFNDGQGRQPEYQRYESPGSLAQDKLIHQGSDISQGVTMGNDAAIDIAGAVEDRKDWKRKMRLDKHSKDWADNMDDNQLETLYPAEFESKWEANQLPSSFDKDHFKSTSQSASSQEQSWDQLQVPTFMSTSTYGINAPFVFPLFPFESHARETSVPTEHTDSRNLQTERQTGAANQTVPTTRESKFNSDQDLHLYESQFEEKLHGIVDSVASGVGVVAGTAVGALSYLFGEGRNSTDKTPKEMAYATNASITATDQQYAKETQRTREPHLTSDSDLVGADEQLFVAKQDNPNLSLGHVDDDAHVLNLHPSLFRPSERQKLSSDQSIGAVKHDGSLATDSNVTPSKSETATDRGIGPMPSERDPFVHPILEQSFRQTENTTDQLKGSSVPASSNVPQPPVSQQSGGSVDQRDRSMTFGGDPSIGTAEWGLAAAAVEGSLAKSHTSPQGIEEPEEDENIKELFNGDPDTVRQPYTLNQPRKTSMDDRRQIWEASMATALAQPASTLGLQPQSKEKKLDLENYHVADSSYKPSAYDPGRNQFDSDFENWKHDSPPPATPTRNIYDSEYGQTENYTTSISGNEGSNIANLDQEQQSDTSAQILKRPAWDRVEFHDPSDYMKGTESHMQQIRRKQVEKPASSQSPSGGPGSWIRRKLSKPRISKP